MSTFQQYNISPWLTPVRLVATSNQSGTYFNGTLNNGVGATLTYATGALTIDSVTVNVGDRILLQAQSSAFQNGIYVCNVAGATGVAAILQRSADQQCIEQLHTGFYVSVAAGTVSAGSSFVMVEPKPAILGVSNMTWTSAAVGGGAGTAAAKAASNNSLATLASVPASVVLGNLAKFADTAGTLADQGIAFKSVAGATNAGGSATTTVTDAFCTTTSCVVANWNTSANAVNIQKVTPGNGSFTVLSSGDPGLSTLNYIITK